MSKKEQASSTKESRFLSYSDRTQDIEIPEGVSRDIKVTFSDSGQEFTQPSLSSMDLSDAFSPSKPSFRSSKEQFDDVTIFETPEDKRLLLLRGIEFFQDLPFETLQKIAQQVDELHFPPETHIIQKGEVGDAMYVIVAGTVQIPIHNHKTKQPLLINLGPGDVFGEIALLTGEPRMADVLTQTACLCFRLQKRAMDRLINEQPKIARFLTSMLGQRLMRTGDIRKVGKYPIFGELGRGGMATVYEGTHPILERPVAIKMLSHELVCRSDFAQQFRTEAKTLALLRHPHIVQIFDTEESYATFFIIMEKLSGVDLRTALKQRGPLPFGETRTILKQIASALDFAHQHDIIHRDIKPSNIMLEPDGMAKLTDFGIAWVPKSQIQSNALEPKSKNKESSTLRGTPYYMSPEQILGNPIDGRVDIYALGILAFKMLTGKVPFRGDIQKIFKQHIKAPMPSLQGKLVDVPKDLEHFIQKATAKDPNARFQTGQEVVAFFGGSSSSASDSIEKLTVKTITLVYDPAKEDEIKRLLQKWKLEASALDNVMVR